MFIMGTRRMAEVLFGVIGSTNVMFAFWQNNSAATHVCKNIPHCSWLRCVWQLWMDTDFGSFADKASLKQTHKQIGMVTAWLHIWILRMAMWRWIVQQRVAQNLGMARSQTPRRTKYENAKRKANYHQIQQINLQVFCGYFAGILWNLRIMLFSRHSALNLQGFCGKGWWMGGGRAWEPEVAPNMRSRVTVGNVWKQWANTRASPLIPRMQQTVLTCPLSWMETTAARVDIHVAGYSIKIMITSVGCSTGLGCPSCPTISVASWSHCHQTLAKDDANYKPIVFHYFQ